MPMNLDYEHKCNLCKVIDNSPFQDNKGVKFIPFTSKFLACFFKSIFNHNKKYSINYMRLLGYANAIVFNNNDFVSYDWSKSKYKDTHVVGTAKVVFVTRNDVDELDEESAWVCVNNYCKDNQEDKYVVPFYLTLGVNAGQSANTYIRTYDFLNDPDYLNVLEHKYLGYVSLDEEKVPRVRKNKDKESMIKEYEKVKNERIEESKTKPSKVTPKNIESKEDTVVDKRVILGDNMTLKEVNDLCQYITDAINFFEAQGINWRSKIKIKLNKESRIDDSCGYPVIINDEDFLEPLPFPDEVVGDQKLANL